MRHILWAVAWMSLGLLITLAAASVLQGVATHSREPVAMPPAVETPPQPLPRLRPNEPGRSLIMVSRGSRAEE